ncbi:hypothetical protein L484_026633 [Morus notabilis]|uniref:Uncharacterized protein n=1 Tax=Morus notabilis TaxID=981085 RepID=W9T0P0_9ROSA|nr:hypothetical protein L484_026633 [Morus notabilis]
MYRVLSSSYKGCSAETLDGPSATTENFKFLPDDRTRTNMNFRAAQLNPSKTLDGLQTNFNYPIPIRQPETARDV